MCDFGIWGNGSFLGFEFAVEMAIIRMIPNVEVRPWNEKKGTKRVWKFTFFCHSDFTWNWFLAKAGSKIETERKTQKLKPWKWFHLLFGRTIVKCTYFFEISSKQLMEIVEY